MFRVGLTGGIGSGKSLAARLLAARGAVVIEADAVARELVAPGTQLLRALAAEFGDAVIASDGSLDRSRLAAVAFASEDGLARLNALTHPPLIDALVARMEDEERVRERGVLVVAAALLVEWDVLDLFDLVVVVTAPLALRVARLERDGLPRAEALARTGAQLPEERLVDAADIVIPNVGSQAELESRVASFWQSLPALDREPQ